MAFDKLISKIRADVFDPKKYQKTSSRTFFEFDSDTYNFGKENSRVVKVRTTAAPIGETSRSEIKLGWMCGMMRDSIVQRPINYSTLMRNNCVLKKDVNSRLEEAENLLSGG